MDMSTAQFCPRLTQWERQNAETLSVKRKPSKWDSWPWMVLPVPERGRVARARRSSEPRMDPEPQGR